MSAVNVLDPRLVNLARRVPHHQLVHDAGDVWELRTRHGGVVCIDGQLDIWATPSDPVAFNVTDDEAVAALNGGRS